VSSGQSLLALAVLSGAALVPIVAQAQSASDGSLEEVVVTAQRREESQQRVPVAVTVITPSQIEKRSSFTPLDLPSLAPGLNVQAFNGDKNALYVSIRGQSFTTGTIYPSVIPYFAEVPLTRLTAGLFFDLENIQVLRGPQGTLFGRVTNGGAVLLEPAKPKFNFEGAFSQKLGNYGLRTTNAMINAPVSEALAVRIAVERGRQDGLVKNVATGVDVNDTDYYTGRLSVRYSPSDRLENLTIVNYQKADENGADSRLSFVNEPAVIATLSGIYGPAGAAAMAAQLSQLSKEQLARDASHTAMDGATSHRRHLIYIVNKTRISLTDDIVLRNIAGYTRFKQVNVADYDGSTIPLLHITPTHLPNNLDDREQFSEELQLQGKSFDRQLDWVAGLYGDLNRNGGPTQSDAQLFGLFRSVQVQTQRASSRAVYGQADYRLSGALEGVRLHGGLRYTWDKVSGVGGSFFGFIGTPMPDGQCITDVSQLTGLLSAVPCLSQKSKEGTLTYNYGIDYQLTPQVFVYAKTSRGYRPGGFNVVPAGYQNSFAPEFDLSRELGLKADWSVGETKVRTNISAFYDKYTDIQSRVSLPITGQTYSLVVNGADAIVKGLEAEITVRPSSWFNLAVRYAYADTHNNLDGYSPEYIAAACPANPLLTARDATKVCVLNKVARVPRNTVDADATVYAPIDPSLGAMSATASFHHISSQDSNDTNYLTPDSRMKGYSVLDLRASWDRVMGSTVDLALFATNVTNKKYIASAGSISEMGNIGIAQSTYGAPRQYGLSLTYRFGGE